MRVVRQRHHRQAEDFIRAFLSTGDEIEEILQEVLDDATLRLEKEKSLGRFYEAYSPAYDNRLDGGQVDERIADYLGVQSCEHWDLDGENLVVLIGSVNDGEEEEEV